MTLPRARAALRPHVVFTAALAAAVLLRVFTMLGYPTTFWFGDSGSYLKSALHFTPSPLRPSGYSLMLWALHPFHDLRLVAGVQHLLGLATAVLLYAVTWRWTRGRFPDKPGIPGLIGTAVAAPVLFDAYQIQLEHMLMSDATFEFLAVAAVAALLWKRRLTWRLGLLAGLLLAAAALTRTIGLPLLAVAVLWGAVRVAARRPTPAWASGWRPLAAMVAVFAVCVGGYAGWYKSAHGRFELAATNGFFLYGRTAAFADCAKIKPPADLAGLCHDWKHDTPGVAPAYAALWGARSPFRAMPGGVADVQGNARAARFAQAAILAQPGDYLGRALRDTARSFSWSRSAYPTPWTVGEYRFPAKPWQPRSAVKPARAYGRATAVPRVVEPFAGWMRSYQRVTYLPGALLGGLLLVGLAGVARRARDWGGPALLPWLTAVALLLVPPFTADFDYRYLLPVVPLAALAAALGWFSEAVSSTSSDL
ncbi:hypothetical protein [Actinomadura oligospora]|uniref:hypothetical protein n=1 Tax=Actinomadura oligospora TaxID=111804 RepID=UPI0012F7D046|nr:hypothetical protein [Actinomadura oligospora]